MTDSTNTIRVVIPLTIRKRNGRPKILPPDEVMVRDGRSQDLMCCAPSPALGTGGGSWNPVPLPPFRILPRLRRSPTGS